MPGTPALPPGCAARFRVVRELGAGGQGAVYLAVQLALQREVALKVLTENAPGFRERFRQEARIAATIAHPNVVAVLDHDVEGGLAWIAYEYVPGISLRERLCEGPLGWREAVAIARGIAAGLGAAHAIGVTHRDVKPENVLLAGDVARLTDFGMARRDAGMGTQPGTILGTPAYLAPEVVRGERPTPAVDVYALGLVLYEMVTGQVAFDGEQPAELLRAQLTDEVSLPTLTAAGSPPDLSALIVRCVAKDPRKRPASASELAGALGELAARSPRGPRPSGNVRSARASRPARDIAVTAGHRAASRDTVSTRVPPGRPAQLAALAAVLVAGLALGAGFALRARRPAPEPSPIVRPSSRPSTPPMIAEELAALERGLDAESRAIDVTVAAARAWEVDLASQAGQGLPNAVPRDAVATLRRETAALADLARELARLASRALDDPGVEARRAQVAGMQFDVWFWRVWLGQYLIRGQSTFSPTDMMMSELRPPPEGGGRPMFLEFSRRLDGLLRRAAAAPEEFDARLGDALFQVSHAFRYLRANGDRRFFSETTLGAELRAWVEARKRLEGPMAADLAEAVRLLSESLVASGDGSRTYPQLAAHVTRAALAHPEATGWPRLAARLRSR